jgi:hypothetical protein
MNCKKRLSLFTSALLFAAALFTTDTAFARALNPGDSLSVGETLASEDGKYAAVMQGDGNFVVYRNDGSGRAVWSTRTTGRGAVRATLQHNGDFTLTNAAGGLVWRAKTNGPNRVAAVSEHGRFMVFEIKHWWESKTGNEAYRQQHAIIFPYGHVFHRGDVRTVGMYTFTFQHDGNVVVLRHGQPIWWTGSNGATHAYVSPGLVVTESGKPRFSMKHLPPSDTKLSSSLGFLAVTPNGNVAAYRAAQVWGTNRDY